MASLVVEVHGGLVSARVRYERLLRIVLVRKDENGEVVDGELAV